MDNCDDVMYGSLRRIPGAYFLGTNQEPPHYILHDTFDGDIEVFDLVLCCRKLMPDPYIAYFIKPENCFHTKDNPCRFRDDERECEESLVKVIYIPDDRSFLEVVLLGGNHE
jgi:hypothetical protein